MHSTIISTAVTLACAALTKAAPVITGDSNSMTPHEQYSSSVGVLGCKINTNRVAYWPSTVDCNNICVQVSYAGRSVYLLKIDQSGGAYDISYDAWNYLYTGQNATVNTTAGGGIAATYQNVDPSNCANLMTNNKRALTGTNSMNYVVSCIDQPGSWVANNYAIYNIYTPT